MKNIYKIFIAFTALIACTSAFAQEVPSKMDSLILNKKAVHNVEDDTYTLFLETYVLGDYTEHTTTVKTTKPVDFVLCLDVSGSMSAPLTQASPLATASYTWKLSSGWRMTSFDTKNLDIEKGKMEGYYSAEYDGLLLDGNADVRYTIENGWEVEYGDWTKFSDMKNKTSIKVYKSKLGSLMDACDSFLDKIEQNQQEGKLSGDKGHKVGVVSFSGSAKDEITLTSIDSKSTIADKIHNLKADGATAADYGLVRAKKMLNLNSNDGRAKVVVLFTDGEPNHQSGFDKDVANTCISVADSIKTQKASVFGISVFDTTVESNMWKYMNYVSSNYPNAKSLTNSGARESDNYYALATNEDALNSAFETIAEESMSAAGGAAIQLNVSETVVRDIVTPSFVVPDGISGAKIYEVPVDVSYVPSSHKIEDIRFVTLSENQKVKPDGVEVKYKKDETTGKTIFDVKGFDFSSKWVGFRHAKKDEQEPTWTVNPGSKLVIEILVETNQEDTGGDVFTNDSNSGIYVGDEPMKNYPIPEVFTPMDFIIRTTPLAEGKGETLLYTITGSNGVSMVVSMTEGEGKIVDGKWEKIVAKLPVKTDDNNDITYTVTPMNNWSWAYGEATAKEQKLIESNVFEIIPTSGSTTKKHAENSANNVFAK